MVPFSLYSIRLPYPPIAPPPPHIAHGPPLKKHTGWEFPPKTIDPVEALPGRAPPPFSLTHRTVSLGVGKACIYVLNLNLELTLEG